MAAAQQVCARVERALAATWTALVEEFGSSPVETAHAKGLIQRVLHGIYAKAGTDALFRVRARALTVWSEPAGAVTGLAAAYLWGVVAREPSRISLQVPSHWSRALPPWARGVHIGAAKRVFQVDGVSTVPVADAVVQAWREAPRDVAVSTVIAAVVDNNVPKSSLLEAVERRSQLPRRDQLIELVGMAGPTVTSYLEYVAWRDVFPPHLFPELDWQVTKWANGRKRTMDACDPIARIDLEFDGGSTHGGVAGFERDRERDSDMRSLGYEPLHFTYRDLTERPEWCRQQYRALRAYRLRHSGRT